MGKRAHEINWRPARRNHRQSAAGLNREEQTKAIRRLAAVVHTEHIIAVATGLAVEQVRRALGDQEHV